MDLEKDLLSYQDLKTESVFKQKKEECCMAVTRVMLELINTSGIYWTLKKIANKTGKKCKVQNGRQLPHYSIEHAYNQFFKSALLFNLRLSDSKKNGDTIQLVLSMRCDSYSLELSVHLKVKEAVEDDSSIKTVRSLIKLLEDRVDINRLIYACCLNNVLCYKRDCLSGRVAPRQSDQEATKQMIFGLNNIHIVMDFSHLIRINFGEHLKEKKREAKEQESASESKESGTRQSLDQKIECQIIGNQLVFDFDKLGVYYYDINAIFDAMMIKIQS